MVPLSRWDSRAALRLAARAALLWGALCGLYALLDWRFTRLAIWTARALASCLARLGLDAQAAGTIVVWQGGRSSFEIVPECTGIYGASMFAAFVLASPLDRGSRLLGLALGTILIAALNLSRLVLLALVQTRFPRFFPVAHDYLWQVLFVLVLAGLYGAWLELAGRRSAPDAAPSLPG
ncbi:MAG TPA: hypothetical protein VNM87_12490 [Candidatus Udaeobacter sp.]|nr:hypothetical protein [Candidatus Udaeobacter sp.]